MVRCGLSHRKNAEGSTNEHGTTVTARADGIGDVTLLVRLAVGQRGDPSSMATWKCVRSSPFPQHNPTTDAQTMLWTRNPQHPQCQTKLGKAGMQLGLEHEYSIGLRWYCTVILDDLYDDLGTLLVDLVMCPGFLPWAIITYCTLLYFTVRSRQCNAQKVLSRPGRTRRDCIRFGQ